jgi:hypothetical protein
MSPIVQKWKRRVSDATYAVDSSRSRWAGAVSKPPNQADRQPQGKRKGIARKS